MATKIKHLKDEEGKFYPYTHESAVVTADGTKLGDKLTQLDLKVSEKLDDAPLDGKQYTRAAGEWQEVVTHETINGSLSTKAINLLKVILGEAVFTSGQNENIESLIEELKKGGGGGTVISDPVISVTDDGELTITCETAGAVIYYTLDESAPNAQSNIYNGTVTLQSSCTIRAIAILGSDSSSIVSAYWEKTTSDFVSFVDDNVKAILVSSAINKDGDSEIKFDEMAAYTSLQDMSVYTLFRGNTEITSFNEFKYFSNLEVLPTQYFKDCTNLVSVTLPDSLKKILGGAGQGPFHGCTSLNTCKMPSGLEEIEERAFFECAELELNELPSSLRKIGGSAFFNCSKISMTSIPEGVNEIEENTFYNCSSLALTSLPSGLHTIGNAAFRGCTKLALTSIPSSISVIPQGAFHDCINMPLKSLPDTITRIDGSAFFGCTSLELTELPSALTSVGDKAFRGCTKLNVPSAGNATTLGTEAFCYCSGMNKEFDLRKVTSIGNYAFEGANIPSYLLPDTPPAITGTALTVFKSTSIFKVSSEAVKNDYLANSSWAAAGASRFVVSQ